MTSLAETEAKLATARNRLAVTMGGRQLSETAPEDGFAAIMVDIETMATHSSRAVILSIGAVPFTLTQAGPLIGQAQMMLVDLARQLADMRQIETGTQGWWARQTDAAREHWLLPRQEQRCLKPLEILEGLQAWLDDEVADKFEVWANGAVFDIGNLDNLFLEAGGKAPWPYNAVRDYRTLRAAFPQQRTSPEADAFLAAFTGHDPVQDCLAQIWRLWKHAPASMLSGDAAPAPSPERGAYPAKPAEFATLVNGRTVAGWPNEGEEGGFTIACDVTDALAAYQPASA